MGDLSASCPGGHRLFLEAGPGDYSDDPLGAYIHCHDGVFKTIHYDGYSRCGRFGDAPRPHSPIDHILVDLSPMELRNLKPVAHLIGKSTDPNALSDHVPMCALFRQDLGRPNAKRVLPRRIAGTPELTLPTLCWTCPACCQILSWRGAPPNKVA